MRARKLARARAAGEELSDFEERALEAHLETCDRCRAYVAEFSDEGGSDLDAAQAEADEGVTARAQTEEGSGEETAEREPAGSRARDSGEERRSGGGDALEDQELPPAPSLGPHTDVDMHRDPEEVKERMSHRSTVDAMGQDKKRQVVGHSYGPSRSRQLLYYGIFVAFVIALYIGGSIAVDELDAPPANNPDEAPWSQPDSPQIPPQRFQ